MLKLLGRPTDRRAAALRRFAMLITMFTIAGAFFLGFEDAWIQPVFALVVAYALELGFELVDARATGRPTRIGSTWRELVDFLLPAHITALSIALLLYPNARRAPIAFAVAVAIGSKYVLRVRVGGRRRHFLNPSNFGVAATLVLFPWVGLAPPYHFTENLVGAGDWVITIAILAAGTMLNLQLTRKGPLILGWVGGFVAQALLRNALLGAPLAGALMPATGLAFWLYTNYMITDPGTSPVAPRNQVAFGAATAMVYGLLVTVHIVFGFFFALVIVSGLRGLSLWLVSLGVVRRRAVEPAPALEAARS